MKIRKFNEELGGDIDVEYVKYCFADLLDSGVNIEERESAAYGKWLQINFDVKKIEKLGEFGSPTPEFICSVKENTEVFSFSDEFEIILVKSLKGERIFNI